MKKPETSRHATDPDLVGSSDESSWVAGRNCVYRDGASDSFRVSIRTPCGWKYYGHFNDIETATYIANVAILIERCEEKYELNRDIGEKDRAELDRWRCVPGHRELERVAADRYKHLQAKLSDVKAQERLRKAYEEARIVEEKAERRKKWQDEVGAIRAMSDSELVELVKSTTIYDPRYQVAKTEMERRKGG